MHSPLRTFLLPLVAAVACLASCSGDNSGSGPEAPWCAVGSIAPGDSVKGELSASSCRTYDPFNSDSVWTEAWTLNLKADSAYIVRLRHVQGGAATDGLNASLYAYANDSTSQPAFATGTWYGFGSVNASGMDNREMFLASHTDRPLSIRVEMFDSTEAGAYTLSVESCRIRPFNGDGTYAAVDVTAGCRSESYANDGHPYRLVFFSYPADTLGDYSVAGNRIAGTGTLTPTAVGPDLDIGCYTANCIWFHPSAHVTSFTYAPHVNVAGRVTLFIGVPADSTATVDVSGTTPGSAGAPRPSARDAGVANRGDHRGRH